MKLFKNYKFILFLTVGFIFLGLFYILYSDKVRLPDDNWSKEIKLKTYSINDSFKDTTSSDNEFIKYKNHFYLIYYSKNSIFLSEYDEMLNEVSNKKVIEGIKKIDYLNVQLESDQIVMKYLEGGEFKNLSTDLKGTIKSNKTLHSNVKKVDYYGSDFLIYKDNKLFLNDQEIKEIKKLENYSFVKKENKYFISYIQYNTKNYKYDLKIIEFDRKGLNEKLISSFSLNNVNKIFKSDLSFSNDNLNVVFITYNQRAAVFTNYEYKIDMDLSVIDDKNYYSKGYNFSYLKNSSSFIQNTVSYIGKIDISTKNEKFTNIALFKNGEEKLLTKTKFFPYKANYYTYNDKNYLMYSKLDKGKKLSVYLSSDDKKLVTKSQKLAFDEMKGLFFTTFTTFLPVSFFGLIYAILFLVPFFIIVLPINLIKLTWAEQNQEKLLFLSIALYLLTKVKYIFFDMELSNLPMIFTNPYLRVLIGLTFSGVAFYSMISILRNKNPHYLKSFFTFFILDITLFTLYYTPYFLI